MFQFCYSLEIFKQTKGIPFPKQVNYSPSCTCAIFKEQFYVRQLQHNATYVVNVDVQLLLLIYEYTLRQTNIRGISFF